MSPRQGPLRGIRVLEFTGIGPGPHCAMLLADLGADVVRIDREGGNGWPNPLADRGRTVVVQNLKSDAGRDFCLKAADKADVVIEGFRPGLMERLGLGPDVLLARNPRLIYGRVTGWGQDGPLAGAAGHDINYIAITGALAAMGQPGDLPCPPMNLLGDFGGGSMLLAFGILAAIIERNTSGKGQVVDASIVDGVSSLMSFFTGLVQDHRISLDRSRNLLGGAAPFYRCYACKDGKAVAVGALEPQFYAELLDRLNAPDSLRAGRDNPDNWEEQARVMADIFASRTRDEWCALLEGTDACFGPVLTLEEAQTYPANRARKVFIEHGGVVHNCPVPRFSRTPGAIRDSVRLTDRDDPWDA